MSDQKDRPSGADHAGWCMTNKACNCAPLSIQK